VWAILTVLILTLILISVLLTRTYRERQVIKPDFNGSRALGDVEYQVNLGPRTPGSEAHAKTVDWILEEVQAAGWQAEVQEAEVMGHTIRNIVARMGEGQPWIILGAHYDSRLVADHDPSVEKRNIPVPGANDGASGVAVLLELARVLPSRLKDPAMGDSLKARQVWLVFFDAEDNGRIPGWDWILGSRAFVAGLQDYPQAAVIVDMIGDADLNIYQERNSNPALVAEIWSRAAEMGYSDRFIPEYKHSILDDHKPFLDVDIPAVDLIDFDYPHWHTTMDTPDKVSAESLQIVGNVLLAWLTGK
jgi:Zn-dependent M28 family amino/carboxypeptidase